VTPGEDVVHRAKWTQDLIELKPEEGYRERVMHLLAAADLGVTGMDIDRETGAVRLRHRTAEGQDVPLDFLTEKICRMVTPCS
jgi:hypothetical protein